jgi:hypothetical protein
MTVNEWETLIHSLATEKQWCSPPLDITENIQELQSQKSLNTNEGITNDKNALPCLYIKNKRNEWHHSVSDNNKKQEEKFEQESLLGRVSDVLEWIRFFLCILSDEVAWELPPLSSFMLFWGISCCCWFSLSLFLSI